MAENKHAKIESKGVDIVAKYGKGFWVREVVSQSPREMGLPQNMLHSFSSATEIIALKDYSTGGQGLLISFCLNFSKIKNSDRRKGLLFLIFYHLHTDKLRTSCSSSFFFCLQLGLDMN